MPEVDWFLPTEESLNLVLLFMVQFDEMQAGMAC